MTDKIVIENSTTGAMEIRQLAYILPQYDIGDVIAYNIQDDKNPELCAESEIIGISADIKSLDGEVVSMYIYELEDGTMVSEDEVEYYYESTDDPE